MNVPMFLLSRRGRDARGRNEADYIPDQSEVVGEFTPEREEEVDQPRQVEVEEDESQDNIPLAEFQERQNKLFTGKLDYLSISVWIRSNPRQATKKRQGLISQITLDHQFGKVNTKETGRFYNFLKGLGDDYVNDVSKVITEEAHT